MRANTLSLVGFGLLALGSNAGAASLLGTTTNPTGFTGLMVGGASYDAIFSTDSYNSLVTGTGAGDPGLAVLKPTPTAASHIVKYSVTVLGNIANGISTSASAMNNAGQVAGSAADLQGDEFAVVWNGAMPTIIAGSPPPGVPVSAYATAINNSGIVVGSQSASTVGGFYPFVWSPTFSGCLSCDAAMANGINDAGRIVGNAPVPGPGPGVIPVTWASPSVIRGPDILPLLNDHGAVAVGINDSGQIVGYSYITCCDSGAGSRPIHATRWASSSAQPKDLGTLGGASSGANNINNRGYIAGWADIGNGTEHAALWGFSTTAFDLGTLGGKASYASGINKQADVVGSAQTAYGAWHAVVWTHKHYKAVDLNGQIGAQTQAITLLDAVATNDKCMIVVNGYNNKTGAAESYVLSLTDQSKCDE